MTELTDLSDTDSSNTAVTGNSTEGNVANMGGTDDLIQAILGMLSRFRNANVFRLRDNTDNTKLLAFDLSGLPTATTATIGIEADGGIRVASTDAGAAAAPTVNLYRNSASPAASDILGQVLFTGEDGAGNTQTYAAVTAKITDTTTGNEDGDLLLQSEVAGVLTTGVTVRNGGILGTATNDNATAGNVGEEITASVAIGSATGLTSGVTANVTSITLTAGDWEVTANAGFLAAATTSITAMQASISTTSATNDTTAGRYVAQRAGAFVPGAVGMAQALGPVRFSVNVGTVVYLVVNASFTVDTLSRYGIIRARRVR